MGDIATGHVIGRYELLTPIAKGGMATVWAARLAGSHGFQKIVAVKMLLPEVTDGEHGQMLLDEAVLAARIQHPNVASVIDFGEHDGLLYLVMEWVDGESLDVILSRAATVGGLPLALSLDFAIQTCRGLHAAHELRDEDDQPLCVVHRDVSPQNVLVTYDGSVKLVDFGIAKAARRLSATGIGEIRGKVAYMSPEQVRGMSVDRRTDVFAMGILVYLLTTGCHPFRGENPAETVHNICFGPGACPPSQYLPDYPRELEAAVLKALARNPDDRFASAHELMCALQHIASELPDHGMDVGRYLRNLLSNKVKSRRSAISGALRIAELKRESRNSAMPGPLSSDLQASPASNVERSMGPSSSEATEVLAADEVPALSAAGSGFPSLRGLVVSNGATPATGARPKYVPKSAAPTKTPGPRGAPLGVWRAAGATALVALASTLAVLSGSDAYRTGAVHTVAGKPVAAALRELHTAHVFIRRSQASAQGNRLYVAPGLGPELPVRVDKQRRRPDPEHHSTRARRTTVSSAKAIESGTATSAGDGYGF